MTPEEWRRNEANRWLAVASRDLHSARLLANEEPPSALFHCQQAAEKSAKAFLTFHGVAFRKTHDLNELGNQCITVDSGLTPLFQEAAALPEYGAVFSISGCSARADEEEAEGSVGDSAMNARSDQQFGGPNVVTVAYVNN